jgi:hypothetical protein
MRLSDEQLTLAKSSGGRHRKGNPPTLYSSDEYDDYSDEESELLEHVLRFRTLNRIHCVTPTQVLWVMKRLGYQRRTT